MPEREALTDPVVTAVVTTVQNVEKKPPILVSIPAPTCGVVGTNAMTRSIANRAYAPIRMGRVSGFFPSISPKTKTSAVGKSGMSAISSTAGAGLGFVKVDAELAPEHRP